MVVIRDVNGPVRIDRTDRTVSRPIVGPNYGSVTFIQFQKRKFLFSRKLKFVARGYISFQKGNFVNSGKNYAKYCNKLTPKFFLWDRSVPSSVQNRTKTDRTGPLTSLVIKNIEDPNNVCHYL